MTSTSPPQTEPETDLGPARTVAQALVQRARRRPDAAALVDTEGRIVTASELVQEIGAWAAVLDRAAIGPSDRVAFVAPQGVPTAIQFLALCACAGCVPLNPMASFDELLRHLRQAGVKALIQPPQAHLTAVRAARELGLRLIEGSAAGATPLAPSDWAGRTAPHHTALVLATSGTTGKPKIAAVSQAQIMARGQRTRALLGLTEADRCLNLMPLCYQHGINSGLLGPLLSGGSTICPSQTQRSQFMDGLIRGRATWYTASVTHQSAVLGWLNEAPLQADTHQLRFVRSGSAALHPVTQQALEAALGVPVIESYGSTEAGSMTANPPRGPRKPGTVGRALDADLAIAATDGHLLPAGEVGEVVVRGPCVIEAYEGDAQATAEAFRDGWYRTGDLGVLDADGYLRLVGRIKDLINRGGEKIAPAEVDAVLLGFEGVAEAVCFAVPHPTLQSDIAAAVVPKPGITLDVERLRAHAAARLSPFKVPRRILLVDALPRGPTGKVSRDQLAVELTDRALAAKGAGHATQAGGLLAQLLQVFRQTLKQPGLGPHDDFFVRGGDSLLAVDLLQRLEGLLQLTLSLDDLARNPSAAELHGAIEKDQVGGLQDVISLNGGGQSVPLFVIGGRFGQVLRMTVFARPLGPGQPVHALKPPGMDWEAAGCDTLESMARHYIAQVRRLQPHGPYRLLGNSFGGLVVFEMALQLRAMGEPVALVGLMDTAMPDMALPGRKVWRGGERVDPQAAEARAATPESARVVRSHVQARQSYQATRQLDVPVDYFFCRGEFSALRYDKRRLWRRVAAQVRFHPVDGRHGEPHEEPQFSQLGSLLRQLLAGPPQPVGRTAREMFGARPRLTRTTEAFALATAEGVQPVRVPPPDPTLVKIRRATRLDKEMVVIAEVATRCAGQALSDVLVFVDGRYRGVVGLSVTSAAVPVAQAPPFARINLLLPAALLRDGGSRLQLLARDVSGTVWGIGRFRLELTA